ncbi:hypothetical protein ACKAV7_014088 [Fusarium commune]
MNFSPTMPRLNNEANILLALQALQNDPKLNLRRAASIYTVSWKTLGRRQKGIQSQRDATPKSRKLSNLEEQTIVQFILDLDSRGFPPRLRCVEEMANRSLADRDAPPVGKRQHRELQTRFFLAKYGIRLDDIWNFDETGFMMGVIASGMVVTGTDRRGRP